MSSNIANQVSYLPSTRVFPKDPTELTFEINRSYIDIANAVNSRTIGIYPINKSAITGDQWFLTSKKQQALRQVFEFTAAGTLTNVIEERFIERFVHGYGAYTDAAGNWYGVIFANSNPIANQVTFYVNGTDIKITQDGAAPVIVRGTLVLEWLSAV